MAVLFWMVIPMAWRAEAQTVRVGLQLGTFASATLYVTVCHPADASSELAEPRSSTQRLSTPFVLAYVSWPNRLIEIGTAVPAPPACATVTAIFAVMVSLSRFVTESVDDPKNSTKEPAEYCVVPLEKSMVSAAQPDPQSRPLGPDVVWLSVGCVESPQVVPHLLSLYGSVAPAVPKVVLSW